jgi:hypothetical protein
VLVQERDSVGGEDALFGARELESVGHVLGDIFGGGVIDGER